MRTGSRTSRRQGGFSAIELLIVLAIIAILGGVYAFDYNPANSKATALLDSAQEYANAMKRAKTDLTCYPTRMDALFIKANATTSFCGLDLTSQWNGRYAGIANANAAGEIVLNNIGVGVTLALTSNTDAAGTHWLITAAGVPNEVITKAANSCNGGGTATGKCVGSPGAGGTGTFSLEFDLT